MTGLWAPGRLKASRGAWRSASSARMPRGAFRSTYGYYDTVTGEARILVANVDTATNPDLANFAATLCLTPAEIDRSFGLLRDPGRLPWPEQRVPGEPLAGW